MTLVELNLYWLSKQGKGLYLFWGGSMGVLKSIFEASHIDFIKTFLLGTFGALGGALIKLMIDLIAKKLNRQSKLTAIEREDYDRLKKNEQKELLLRREEELGKNGL